MSKGCAELSLTLTGCSSRELALLLTAAAVGKSRPYTSCPDSTVDLALVVGMWVNGLERVSVGEITLPLVCWEMAQAQR